MMLRSPGQERPKPPPALPGDTRRGPDPARASPGGGSPRGPAYFRILSQALVEVDGKDALWYSWDVIVKHILTLLCALAILAAALLVIFRTTGTESSPRLKPCPEGWMYYRKQCFLFSDVEKPWASSQDHCLSHGAALAVIPSQTYLKFIASHMGTSSFWVGLRKNGEELTWVNGARDTWTLLDAQAPGQCAYIHSAAIFLSRCDLPRNWICSKEPYQ